MNLKVGKIYYFSLSVLLESGKFIAYKVISTHKYENITIYECEITLTNHPTYYVGDIIMIKHKSVLHEYSEELTNELKAELL